MRGLSRRQRSLVGLAFVAVAFVIFVVFLRAFEVARGVPFLSPPKAEDGLLFFIGLVVIVIFPYMVGKSWLAFFIVPESASSALISINKAAPATEPPLISDKLV